MRHRYDCPLRWADLDPNRHINNVKYVDYLQEARSALLTDCLRAAGVRRDDDVAYVVARHEVTFVAPLRLSQEPIGIESWVSDTRAASFTLDHEIFRDQPDGTRVVHLRARTVLAPFDRITGMPRRVTAEERAALAPYEEIGGGRCRPVPVEIGPDNGARHPIPVRFSDLDIYRHVNNVKYVEYFQEARIAVFAPLRERLAEFGRVDFVVARTDIDYLTPMVLRSEPYVAYTNICHVGRTSLGMDSVILTPEGDVTCARARSVLVFFDVTTQRATQPPAGYLPALAEALGLELPV